MTANTPLRRTWLVLSWAALVAPTLLSRPASAQAPPSLAERLVGDAKRDYQEGRRLYENRDFGGALVMFQRASQASDDPRLWWNEAACEMAMRHYARAIVLVRRYLDSRSPWITQNAERNAQEFLAAAEPLTARLDVQMTEPDATVYVDDERVGATPLGSDVRVDPGTHRITAQKPGFADYSTTFAAAAAEDVHVSVTLEKVPSRGRLAIRAGGGDAISIDGALVGLRAWEGLLPAGSHTVKVAAPDTRAFESTVELEDGQARALDVTLEPLPHHQRVATWVWVAGGAVLTAGAVAAGYFLLKPSDGAAPIRGSAGTIQLP